MAVLGGARRISVATRCDASDALMAVTDRAIILEDGPWNQMIDSLSPASRKEGAYKLGQNVYPMDSEVGEAIVGRPGTRVAGNRLSTTEMTQAIVQFPHGTSETTVAIAGGEIFTFDYAAETWTKVVTTANLTTAGITLVGVGFSPVACLVFGNSLFVSDQVNHPFLWDGTTGAGGLTNLANCPPLYGQPTVHQARIFGIKASDLHSMVWSEADNATTGYEAGGFSNVWTLRQTDAHPLTRLVGTNAGLVIFRARSITMAYGDVGDLTFQSTDTREAIDSTVGTNTPFAVLEVGPNIVFLSADMQPYLSRPGATGVVPLWQNFRNTIVGGAARVAQQGTFAVHYTPANLILFAVPDSVSNGAANTILVLDAKGETPVPVAVWNGWNDLGGASISAMGMVRRQLNTTSIVYWMHGDYGDSGGYVYLHGNPDDTTFLTDDTMVLGTLPITHIVHLQPLGYSTKREKIMDRIDASFRGGTVQTVLLSAASPRGDVDPVEVDVLPGAADLEVHATLGIDVLARWIAPVITHQAIGEQFGLTAVSVTAYPMDDDPSVP
jgi:hypothetical protein